MNKGDCGGNPGPKRRLGGPCGCAAQSREKAIETFIRFGCGPDNAHAEGFFGRLKIEFFYGRGWNGVALDEFADMLDAYLRWYRDVRLKSDLGCKSPMQYRRDLGLIA